MLPSYMVIVQSKLRDQRRMQALSERQGWVKDLYAGTCWSGGRGVVVGTGQWHPPGACGWELLGA
jgi:hypothetical protein